ncbi:MAG: SGNH/GDSL hydrolase family protein [Desulfobacteraceae bacterium]|nr:SGNH/GDSL hydrolase family protein [Desulfobacteraceae bacterium]
MQAQKNCVVMLGDSIFALTGQEPAALERLSGSTYRHYYVSGAQLAGGSVIAPGDIEDQLNRAINQGSIRTIIMDGGGNDFLLGVNPDSMVEAELKSAWGRILTKAANAGVQTIIFQGYYKTTTATAFQLSINDNIIAWLPAQGAAHGIALYTYNPNADSWFKSRLPSSYTLVDGIHPTQAASQHMAQMLWNLMVKNKVEQTTSCSSSSSSSSSSTSGGCN